LNALAIASGGIPNAVSSVSFVISPIDRIAFKSAVSITLGFKPSVPIPPGSVVALIYPSGFFAPGITPIVARGSTSIPDITMSCSPTTATRITIVTSGAAIAASHFAATLSGLTMGQATDGGSVTVQTSGAYSARVLSGPISGIAPASLTISHALPNALQGDCGFPSLTPPPPHLSLSPLAPLTRRPDLAAAIEWSQGFRSTAAAAAGICSRGSNCSSPAIPGTCDIGIELCTQQQLESYHVLLNNMHARLSKHSSIVDPLEQSLKDLSASSAPALQHAAHSMVLATQALRHSIVQHHSCILALLSRPPPSQHHLRRSMIPSFKR
jgi:hypothetical protein